MTILAVITGNAPSTFDPTGIDGDHPFGRTGNESA